MVENTKKILRDHFAGIYITHKQRRSSITIAIATHVCSAVDTCLLCFRPSRLHSRDNFTFEVASIGIVGLINHGMRRCQHVDGKRFAYKKFEMKILFEKDHSMKTNYYVVDIY